MTALLEDRHAPLFNRTTDTLELGHLDIASVLDILRILGIFSRLAGRDGKQRYLSFMPREWGHLARTLQHPSLADTRAFVESVARPYLEKVA
jgi:aminoglycoside/choline kinase family phosphotransferase